MCGGQPGFQRGSKLGKGRIIVRVQTLLAHKPPQALDQVEVRRERGQVQQFDPQCRSIVLHHRALLIPRVVEHHCDRTFRDMRGKFAQQLAYRFRSHGGLVHHGDDLFAQRIHGSRTLKRLRPDGVGMK